MLSTEPKKAEADNTYGNLDYLGYHKNGIELLLFFIIIHCFDKNNNKHTVARNLN